jgi:hypothetical protein
MLLKRHTPGIVVAILCGAVSTATLAQSAGPTVQAGVREVLLLSGTLTLRDTDSGKTLVVHQGQATGESGDEPTVLLITYAGIPGVPTSVPAKGEKPEY